MPKVNTAARTATPIATVAATATPCHEGLSGSHFLRTLLQEQQLDTLLNDNGLVNKLVEFWEKASCGELNSNDLLSSFDVLNGSGLMLYFTTEDVKHPIKRLGNNSYNTMDYLRSLYNIWELVLRHPTVIPCEKLFLAMLQCQSKPAETKAMLQQFGLTKFGKIADLLERNKEYFNWTTFFVLLSLAYNEEGRSGSSTH